MNTLRQITGAILLTASAAMGDGIDGLYQPDGTGYDWACNPAQVGEDGGALAIQDGWIHGVENSCQLTAPVRSGNSTRYKALCSAEGTNYEESVVITPTAEGVKLKGRGHTIYWTRCTGNSTIASDNRWVSGHAQGTFEASITEEPGNSIYVTCGETFVRPITGISFTLRDRPPTGSRVTLTFDNEDPEDILVSDGRIGSNCRACAATYEYVVEKLRAKNSVHVRFENGDSARFTLKGSRKAIVECISDFYVER